MEQLPPVSGSLREEALPDSFGGVLGTLDSEQVRSVVHLMFTALQPWLQASSKIWWNNYIGPVRKNKL